MASGTLRTTLSLPTELRLRIYEVVIPENPLCVHRTVYSGLLYACKQTQYEIELIILAAMNTDLMRIEEICLRHFAVEIVFQALSNLHALENTHITARSEWLPLDPTMRLWNPFMSLIRLHFKTLVIEVGCKHDKSTKRHRTPVDFIITRVMIKKAETERAVQCKSITINYSAAISRTGNIRKIDSYRPANEADHTRTCSV
jgi:hypothetical protein